MLAWIEKTDNQHKEMHKLLDIKLDGLEEIFEGAAKMAEEEKIHIVK